MCAYKKVIITGFIAILIVIFSNSIVLCKPPEKSEPELIITPNEVSLSAGEQLQFKVEVKNDETIIPSEVKWQVMGNIGEISSDGLFKASDKPARGMVRASAKVGDKQLTVYALVKVAEGKVPSGEKKRIVVIVEPALAIVLPEGTQQFKLKLPEGVTPVSTKWRVAPASVGSIDQNGLFTASQKLGSKGIVVATVQTSDGTGTGRANVTVSVDTVSLPKQNLKVNIKPNHARVNIGDSTTFVAEATGVKKSQQYDLDWTWTVNPAELGDIEPNNNKATFTANNEGKEGRALVIAIAKATEAETQIAMGWATVDVGEPGKPPLQKFKVTIEPDSASMAINETKQFTAYITGGTSVQPSWSVAPRRLGNIDDSGLFIATATGWGLVIAKVDTGKTIGVGQAKVFVGAESPVESKPLRIEILPQTAETFVNGDPVMLKAQIVDMQGKPVTGMTITWKAVPKNTGTFINQTGDQATFKPGNKAGHVLITAQVVGAKGTTAHARITITDQARDKKLNANISGPSSLKVGNTYSYEVSVTDSEGKRIESGVEYKWRVAPSNQGTIVGNGASATFTPEKAGACVILVEVKTPQGNVTGRISITVEKK